MSDTQEPAAPDPAIRGHAAPWLSAAGDPETLRRLIEEQRRHREEHPIVREIRARPATRILLAAMLPKAEPTLGALPSLPSIPVIDDEDVSPGNVRLVHSDGTTREYYLATLTEDLEQDLVDGRVHVIYLPAPESKFLIIRPLVGDDELFPIGWPLPDPRSVLNTHYGSALNAPGIPRWPLGG